MPQPGRASVHVNRPLTTISEAYLQDQTAFVAGRVMPTLAVQAKSDNYYRYDQFDFQRDGFQLRAPGAESPVAGYELSTDTYNCQVYSLASDIDEQVAANADAPLNMEADATKMLMNQYLIHLERAWADTYFKASVWSGAADDASWNWSSGSEDPVADIQNKIDAVHQSSGYYCNTLVLSSDSFRMLLNHSSVIDRIKYTQTGTVTEGLIASMLGVPRIFVMRSTYANKAEGEGSQTLASIGAAASALLMYVPSGPSLMQPSAGYQFVWSRYLAGSAGQRVFRYDMVHRRSTRIEVECAYDFKVTSANAGAWMSAVTS